MSGSCTPGLQRYREASLVLEQGLEMDPFNPAIKAQLEVATQGVLADLLQGELSWAKSQFLLVV